MADPRLHSVEKRKDPRSRLMREQAKCQTGEKVNFCPFRCADEDLDEFGYCYHLIGFTNDGKEYEPMEQPLAEDGTPLRRIVRGNRKLPVLKTDILEPISVSSRVYRDIVAPKNEQLTGSTRNDGTVPRLQE